MWVDGKLSTGTNSTARRQFSPSTNLTEKILLIIMDSCVDSWVDGKGGEWRSAKPMYEMGSLWPTDPTDRLVKRFGHRNPVAVLDMYNKSALVIL